VILDYDNRLENQILNDFIRVKGGQLLENNGTNELEVTNSTGFDKEIQEIGSKSPFSICFSGKANPLLKKSVEKKGFYFIEPESIHDFFKIPFINELKVFHVNKGGKIKSWKDFKILSHNFNTIVILDRFLFSRNNKATHSGFRETVSEIIANLLEKNHASEIDVLLVTVKNSGGDVGLSLKEIKEAIELELKQKQINSTIKINISIARSKQITDDNHDRLVFTNFCAMYSGNSFNYFENRSLKYKPPAINTALNVYSILDVENWEPFLYMLKSRKKELPTKEDLNIPNEDLQEGKIDVDFLKSL
jgi:hypothetical protein